MAGGPVNVAESESLSISEMTTLNTRGNGTGKSVKIYRAWEARTVPMFFYYLDELHVDYDGAPRAFAPIVSASDPSPQPGFHPLDSLKNARSNAKAAFDPQGNNAWVWTGVRSGKEHVPNVDARIFLKDRDGNFPIKRPDSDVEARNYYFTQTAMTMKGGEAVNALKVPFGVVSGLRNFGLWKGDYGLVINIASGAALPVLFCDTQGTNARGVAEFSAKVSGTLGRNGEFLIVCFPGTRLSEKIAHVETTAVMVRSLLTRFSRYKNLSEILDKIFFRTYRINAARALVAHGLIGMAPLAVKPSIVEKIVWPWADLLGVRK